MENLMTTTISTDLSPVLASRIELWPLDRLKLYQRRARQHSEDQILQIAHSIGEFGFTNPILVNAQDVIIVGAARYVAAQWRKLAQVPVIVLDHLTEGQQRAYRIADNQLALNASWDEEALRLELQELVDEALSLDLLGFSQEELKRLSTSPELQRGLTHEDAVPPAPAVCISRPGDVWQLDQHRVLCGDATRSESLERLLNGAEAAMTFTDPPYNVDYGDSHAGSKRSRTGRPIANDNLGPEFEAFLAKACRNLLSVTSGAVYMCMSSSELHTLYKVFTEAGATIPRSSSGPKTTSHLAGPITRGSTNPSSTDGATERSTSGVAPGIKGMCGSIPNRRSTPCTRP
jgi:hypothetical protein